MNSDRVIGRDTGSSIKLDDSSVSSRHAVLSVRDHRFWIVDLNSTNGTFVNGRRVTEAIVSNEDVISFGTCARVFRDGLLVEVGSSTLTNDLLSNKKRSNRQGFQRNKAITKNLSIFSIFAVAVVLLFLRFGIDSSSNYSQPSNIEDLIARFRSGSVKIDCSDQEYEYSGSGFPVSTGSLGSQSNETLIVTNFHVVQDCDPSSLTVSSNSGSELAVILKYDVQNDLALLSSALDLAPFPVDREAPVGSWVMAIGNPLGIDGNVTFGTITTQQNGLYVTDAAINSGNSGGPLVNSKGRVVGVNVAKLEGADNIGFSIPISVLCKQLVECE